VSAQMKPAPDGTLKWTNGRFAVLVTLADGTRPWLQLEPEVTHAEAKRRAPELVLRARRTTSAADVLVTPPAHETVAEWVERWLLFREARGLESVRDDRSRLRNHALPILGATPMREVSPAQLEDVRDRLDQRIRDATLSWKTASHVWATVKMAFHDAHTAKDRSLRVRDDNPSSGLAAPDRGMVKAKQFLYPSEYLKLTACPDVPLLWKRVVTLSIYLYLRAAELEALAWEDVDLVHGTVHIHRSLRRYTHEEKQTKTGGTRRFAFEPTLRPLLEQMHRESGGQGRVLGAEGMPDKYDLANGLRVYLAMAGVERDELFTNDATRKWITFHDLRATGITWMAVRGDEPLRIKQRAGHSCLSTTEGYIRVAEELQGGFGDVFGPLASGALYARP